MRLAVYTIICIALWGCEKEPTTWSTNISAPLIRASLGIEDLFADSLLEYGPDNSVSLVYEEVLFEYTIDTIAEIDPDTLEKSFTIFPISQITVNPGQTFFNSEDVFEFSDEDVSLSEALISRGKFIVATTNTVEADLVLEINIPKATINGESLSITTTIPKATPNGIGMNEFEQDITGYLCDLSGGAGNEFNTLSIIFTLSLAEYEEPTIISLLDEISILTFYQDLAFSTAVGYLGSDQSEINERESFLDLSSLNETILDLNEVNGFLSLSNGFGVDIAAQIFELSAFRSETGEIVPLEHQIIGSNINMARASMNSETLIPYQRNYEINSTNSNIEAFIELLGDSLLINASAELNPLGNISNYNDFVAINSSFELETRIEIPLSLSLSNLVISDTIEFDWPEGDFEIEEGRLYLLAENSFPADGRLSLLAIDQNGNTLLDFEDLLDTESSDYIQGTKGGEPLTSILVYNISPDETDLLQRAKSIILRTDFETTSYPELVEFRADNTLEILISTNLNSLISL